jgi:hypothetical protein
MAVSAKTHRRVSPFHAPIRQSRYETRFLFDKRRVLELIAPEQFLEINFQAR